MSKSINKIVDYLEHPKVIREFKGSTLDGMLEVEFDTQVLKDMINALSQKELNDLISKVTVVCAQWKALRVAPGNDIGTVARYQDADLIIGKRLIDMVENSSQNVTEATPSRPVTQEGVNRE